MLRTTELLVARVRELSPGGAPTAAPPVDVAPTVEAPASAPVAPAAAPMRARGSRVNGGRVALYYGAALAVMVVAGGAALLFGR